MVRFAARSSALPSAGFFQHRTDVSDLQAANGSNGQRAKSLASIAAAERADSKNCEIIDRLDFAENVGHYD